MNQLTIINIPEIEIKQPVRFEVVDRPNLSRFIDRDEIPNIAEGMARLATGERLQGIIDLATALGVEVVKR